MKYLLQFYHQNLKIMAKTLKEVPVNWFIIILGSIRIIEADIALESWLFGFRPCSGQGQFTLALAQILTIEAQDQQQPI